MQSPQDSLPIMQSPQMLPRERGCRYLSGRNMPDGPIGGVPGAMHPVPYDNGGTLFRNATFSLPLQTGALAAALANATPEQQRTVNFNDGPFTSGYAYYS